MKIKLLIFLFPISIMFSCMKTNKVENDIKELVGREIVFPNGGKIINKGENLSYKMLTKKGIKILAYFDYLNCSSCDVKLLEIYNEEIKKIDPNIAFIGVICNKDEKSIYKMFDTHNISIPIIYYNSESFGEVNNLKNRTARCKTFLLDKENKIVLVGEPFNSEKLRMMYKKQIDKLRKS